MDAVLYVGELNLVSPEIIKKLERYGLDWCSLNSR